MSFTNPFGSKPSPFSGSLTNQTAGGIASVPEEEDTDLLTSPTTRHGFNNVSFRPTFQDSSALANLNTQLQSQPAPEGCPTSYNFGRRTSVSAETLKPSNSANDNWSPPVYAKSEEQASRLRAAIQDNFLFNQLDDEQRNRILGAFMEKVIPAKDIKVIVQGDPGDFFYIVEKGLFHIYVHKAGALQPGNDGLGDKVATIEAGGSFGELALMYNAPRAATVVSAEANCVLWALDRLTFRRILMEYTLARRRMFQEFLEDVPLLSPLEPYERSKIADSLATRKYAPGQHIVTEGDLGNEFFLLESGEADAYKLTSPISLKRYTKGDYFGELALLNDAPRAATVVARTDVKVACMKKSAFQRLLGPVENVLRRTKYVQPDDAETGGAETEDAPAPEST